MAFLARTAWFIRNVLWPLVNDEASIESSNMPSGTEFLRAVFDPGGRTDGESAKVRAGRKGVAEV